MREIDIEQQLAAFGANLRAARRRARVTQEWLSSAASIDRPAVSLLEKGWRAPNLRTLQYISHSLGVQPAELLRGIGGGREPVWTRVKVGPQPFSDKLRHARYEAGLSQRALSEGSKIDVMAISMYEQGRRAPNLRTILKLAQALEISPAMLLLGVTPAEPTTLDDEP